MEYKALAGQPIEITDERLVKSIFAVMGNIDDGGDRIFLRAFAKTIKERAERIKVLWQHDASEPPIAVPQVLKELKRDDLPPAMQERYPDAAGGLYGEVRYLETPRGDEVLAGIKGGAITENSIGYDPVRFDFEEIEGKGTVRNLRELRLWDISPVNWGMNAATMNMKKVIPYKKTPVADVGALWDGPAEVAAAEVSDLKIMCAWVDADNADIKTGYKLPHHKASGDHVLVWRGVAAAMGALLGSRGGVDIPDSEARGVYDHLAKHYTDDFDKEPPDWKLVDLARSVKAAHGVKVGRVLSAANLERLKNALATLQEILLAAEPPDEDTQKALTAGILARLAIADREADYYLMR
jgi:hypothetical protein